MSKAIKMRWDLRGGSSRVGGSTSWSWRMSNFLEAGQPARTVHTRLECPSSQRNRVEQRQEEGVLPKAVGGHVGQAQQRVQRAVEVGTQNMPKTSCPLTLPHTPHPRPRTPWDWNSGP